MVDQSRVGSRRTTVATALALTTAALPVFLLGALSDAIRVDLGISETAVGAAVTVLFLSAAVAATPAGRLTERVGARRALRAGVVLSGLATAATGAFANGWWQIALPFAVVGVATGLIDTGAARAFVDGVPRHARGLAFGIKEASVPAASLLAGVALPTIAAGLGWRATFVAAMGVSLAVLVALGRAPRRRTTEVLEEHVAGSPGRAMLRFAVAAALGTGSATAAATFLVPSATSRGVSAAAAGTLLAVASTASIAARLLVGRAADRTRLVPVRAVAVMLAGGAVGAANLAVLDSALAIVLAAALTLGAGWGWTGLAFLAAVRARPGAPAAAAGVVLTGLGTGGALGPLAFGAAVDRWSYATAWWGTATALAMGAALALSARHDLAHGADPGGQGG